MLCCLWRREDTVKRRRSALFPPKSSPSFSCEDAIEENSGAQSYIGPLPRHEARVQVESRNGRQHITTVNLTFCVPARHVNRSIVASARLPMAEHARSAGCRRDASCLCVCFKRHHPPLEHFTPVFTESGNLAMQRLQILRVCLIQCRK